MAVVAFWAFYSVLAVSWILYPGLVMLATRRHEEESDGESHTPGVSVVIAAHNEESAIAGRIDDCLAQEYGGALEVIVVSDHSTDDTVQVARSCTDPRLRVLESPRRGKNHALTAGVRHATGEIIVFTDADTRFDPSFLARLVTPYLDSEVGCVAGRLVWQNADESPIARGGVQYWNWETRLRTGLSQVHALGWATGACFSVRKSLFVAPDPRYSDDVVIPLAVVGQGARVVYAPLAVAHETRIATASAEFRSRARMCMRGFGGAMSRLRTRGLWRNPRVATALLLHKVLRWWTPYLLVGLAVANAFLLASPFYRLTGAAQVGFYGAGLLGGILACFGVRPRILAPLLAFLVALAGMAAGVAMAFGGKKKEHFDSAD